MARLKTGGKPLPKSDSGCSSPLRRNPGRQTRSSASNTPMSSQNKQSGELSGQIEDEAMDSGSSKPQGVKGKGLASLVAVTVPIKQTSPYADSSSSSSGTQSRSGFETPATSIAVTPAESESASAKPRKRVNASARALELRTSSYSLHSGPSTRKRGIGKVSTKDTSTESSDAQLARALQAEEYEDSSVKRAKRAKSSDFSGIHNSTDSENDDLLADEAWLTANEKSTPSRGRSAIGKGKTVIPESDASSLSDLDSDFSAMEDPAADIEEDDEMEEDDEYKESDSNDKDAHSEEDTDAEEVSAPVVQEPVRPSARTQQRGRASRRGRRASLSPDGSPSMMRLTRRARTERKKLVKQHPFVKTMWKTLAAVPVIKPTPAPQPPDISRKLKPFQLEGLNWMIQQEKSQWKGGLLGDEMGMGKTIQAVSLLMSDYPVGKPSLVVVPPVALMQWQSEIKDYTNGKLKVLVYHNSNSQVKHLTVKDLRKYDVIMISYSGLESMYRKEMKGFNRQDGIVKEDNEAHSIKQRTTSVARACFALRSTYKWCLSGTPVQNRIGEFFSLLRFLEVKPFAAYLCKQCPCNQLQWSQDKTKRCTHCRHGGFQHISIFNQDVLNPITETSGHYAREVGLDKLRLITDRIMLRRVKRDNTASMELPPKRIIIHSEFFGEIERDFSTSIMTNTSRQFDTYVSRGVMLNNYANIFGLIMQMRQVANHPDLILKKNAEGGQNVMVCNICADTAEHPIRSRCHHDFCRQCVKDYLQSVEAGGEADCPRCHIPLSIDFEQPEMEQAEDMVKKNSIINRIKMEDWTSSTKIEMLIGDLFRLRSMKTTKKSIVFSQFTSMLQLVEWRLQRAGFETVMLDGSMTPAQRQKSIEYFMNNTNVEVFLVSLKAGGVALNLTEASRVFIVDPWWNPAAEWQSADRCHRIGQKRPCKITRLCIEDSVESRMVLLQEKKANMINGTINKDGGAALERLTPQDMQFLFRGS
ncbi:DNA repair protein rad16 [Arachnomyces sp. PD_36]|nr:DNA repair protein rad16 [Arachnomyces sp. PD_36]